MSPCLLALVMFVRACMKKNSEYSLDSSRVLVID